MQAGSECARPGQEMNVFERFLEDDLVGVRFAINVLIGTTALWLLLRVVADTDPIWAIASMIAASEPRMQNAVRIFRARIINALVGCAVGLLFLVAGGASAWKLPVAISAAVLVSSYVVRIQTMWRQAPDHRCDRHRRRLGPSLRVERHRARPSQGRRGDRGLRDGPLSELGHVQDLATARAEDRSAGRKGIGRVTVREPSRALWRLLDGQALRVLWPEVVCYTIRLPQDVANTNRLHAGVDTALRAPGDPR